MKRRCPNCAKYILEKNISISIEQHYDIWETLGLFEAPDSGASLTYREKTGKYKCVCGVEISMIFQGDTGDYIITGATHVTTR